MWKNQKEYLCSIAGNVKCSATMQKSIEAAQKLETEIKGEKFVEAFLFTWLKIGN